MWGLAIFCGVLRKPVMARGIHCYHWSSYSLCPAQRHKLLTCNANSLTLTTQLPMPAIFSQRLIQYGKAATKKTIERKIQPKDEKALTVRKMKPNFEEMSKAKITKSNMKSRVDELPKEEVIQSKTKPRVGEPPRQKNINNKMKLKVEEKPEENIRNGKMTPKASEEKIGKIKIKCNGEEALTDKSENDRLKHKIEYVSNTIKPKNEELSMEKNTYSMVKPRIEKTSAKKNIARKIETNSKVKETPKVKIAERKMKPLVEVTPNKKIAKNNVKPQVEVTPKNKIKAQVAVVPKKKIINDKIKPLFEVTSSKKINKRKKKPDVQETSKEKSTKSKIKFKVEETPKVKITEGKIKPQVEVNPNKKIVNSSIKPQVEVIPKSKIKAQVAVVPKNKILTSKIKPSVGLTSNRKINKRKKKPEVQGMSNEKNTKSKITFNVEETPKVKFMERKVKPQVEVIPNKKIAKSNIKPQVEVTPKSKSKAQVAVDAKKKIQTSRIKPLVEFTANRKINKIKKRPKVRETSKEKSTKSKVKLKLEETSKDNANMNVHEQVTQVLQDYLYYTRGLPFADASHISLNAPSFVRKLLSFFPPQKHNSLISAVKRHLLYNSINEFEPFFESIGIQHCDIHGLLPHHCPHLIENQTLLAAVSTLTNIGFPRHRLGKLYVERPHLFSSSSGELQTKLQFYENIGVSKASLVSVLTWCPTLLDDDVYKQFVKVASGLNGFHLEKNRICCLTEENRDIQSSILEKLMLLVGMGCSWDEISKLYHTKREIFINSSEQGFYSIIEMFSSWGLRRKDIGSFVLQCPEILQSISLDKKETLELILHHVQDLHECQLNEFLEGTVRTVCEKELSILLLESDENKRHFIRACISGLQNHGQERKGWTTLFILEQLCNIICPSKPEAVYLLILSKAHTQEEFIRGSMTKNPYSSVEIGQLMWDVKNKICHQLDLIGLLEDDYGMDLLVAGNIISLDLSIAQVFEQVWRKKHNQATNSVSSTGHLSVSGAVTNRDCPPMTVTYRLQGLDGEATEPMIKELEEDTEDSQDPEVEFAIAGAVRECGGLDIILNIIQHLSDDELRSNQEESGLVLKLLMYCCKIRDNRRALLRLGALALLLETARRAFSVDAVEPAEGILLIVESLVMEANESDIGITKSALITSNDANGAGEQAAKVVMMFLERLCHPSGIKKSNKQQRNNEMVARILPYLTYGEQVAMEVLVEHFNPYLKHWTAFDEVQKRHQENVKDESLAQQAAEQRFAVQNFVKVSESIKINSCGEKLKDIIIDKGIARVAVQHLKDVFAVIERGDFKSSPEWIHALQLPSVPVILSMLRGLARGHLTMQQCIDRGGILPLLHALEGVSGESEIGARAENLLDTLAGKDNKGEGFLADKVHQLRHATRDEMRCRALRRSEELLQVIFSLMSIIHVRCTNTAKKCEGKQHPDALMKREELKASESQYYKELEDYHQKASDCRNFHGASKTS